MSFVKTKATMGFPTRSDTNRAVQAQEMARGWNVWTEKVEELYYPCSEKKGARFSIKIAQVSFDVHYTCGQKCKQYSRHRSESKYILLAVTSR